MNQLIIENFEKLLKYYNSHSEFKFKAIAISRALSYIKKYEYPITSGEYAHKNIPHIGEGISKRIDEILEKGYLSELQNKVDNSYEKGLEELMKISGIGKEKAKNLYLSGIHNIQELKSAIESGKIKSTHHINIGLKYFEDIEERLTRDEIKEIEVILKNEFNKYFKKGGILNICGSYRRGLPTSGDIDVLITSGVEGSILKEYVERLKKVGLIADDLTEKGDKKYMGVCYRLKDGKYTTKVCRIDIRYIGRESYYAALLYFTGSKNFNIKIRNEAIKEGYSLSEYGFKDKNGNHINGIDSEEDIFKILSMQYVEPKDRNL